MADANQENTTGKLALITTDDQLTALVKAAIPNSDSQEVIVMQQPVGSVIAEVRNLEADAMIIDIDATNVEDFEHLQKIKRMVNNLSLIHI